MRGAKRVRIETDHATLSSIPKQRDAFTRLGYWLGKLADFDLEVVHKPGKQSGVADAIRRRTDFVNVIQEAGEREDTEAERCGKAYQT